MPTDLYSTDALAWAERQASLLERLARGERVNEAIDWPNVVEEVRDVGLSELRAVKSLLTRALEHLLKLHGWPESRDANHWRVETLQFLLDASAECAPSMRGRIDVSELYRRALLPYTLLRIDGQAPGATPPEQCPFVLNDLLIPTQAAPDMDGILRRLSGESG